MTAHEDATAGAVGDRPRTAEAGILDWSGTARRLRRIALVLAAVLGLTFIVLSAQRGEVAWSLLGELLGIGLLVTFVIEVVVVGGTAFRAMLTAGERGERLASQDVGLLPPQVLRRARGDTDCAAQQGCDAPTTAPGRPDPAAEHPGPG